MSDTVPDEAALRRQVDRRQLQEIVAGLGEGILLVDLQDGIVWANEMALKMHDVIDVAALGTTAAGYRKRFALRYRNNHPLADDQYPLDRLLAGESFHDVVVEVHKLTKANEDWRSIHQIRGLTLTDANGEAESCVLVIQDVTERFVAEERFERTFNANPAPAVICRLADLRYIKVNRGFQEMTGFSRDEVIDRTIYEIDVLEHAEDRDAAVASLRDGSSIPQTEALLRTADGGAKFVIVAGQPIEVDREECMLFTFMDMEARKLAENALRQSEERFGKAFRLTPVPTVLSSRKGFRLLDVNDAFVSVLGYSGDDAVGRSSSDWTIWVNTAERRQFERDIEGTGSIRNLEAQLRTADNEVLDCLISAELVRIGDEDCILTVIQDISERNRSEVELIAAIEAVMQDTSWFSRTVIEKLANLRQPRRANALPVGLADFTRRETEVLGLMCQGLSDAEIVEALGLTRNTVRNHIARIYNKADVHSRAAAVVWARERGFTGQKPAKP